MQMSLMGILRREEEEKWITKSDASLCCVRLFVVVSQGNDQTGERRKVLQCRNDMAPGREGQPSREPALPPLVFHEEARGEALAYGSPPATYSKENPGEEEVRRMVAKEEEKLSGRDGGRATRAVVPQTLLLHSAWLTVLTVFFFSLLVVLVYICELL